MHRLIFNKIARPLCTFLFKIVVPLTERNLYFILFFDRLKERCRHLADRGISNTSFELPAHMTKRRGFIFGPVLRCTAVVRGKQYGVRQNLAFQSERNQGRPILMVKCRPTGFESALTPVHFKTEFCELVYKAQIS